MQYFTMHKKQQLTRITCAVQRYWHYTFQRVRYIQGQTNTTRCIWGSTGSCLEKVTCWGANHFKCKGNGERPQWGDRQPECCLKNTLAPGDYISQIHHHLRIPFFGTSLWPGRQRHHKRLPWGMKGTPTEFIQQYCVFYTFYKYGIATRSKLLFRAKWASCWTLTRKPPVGFHLSAKAAKNKQSIIAKHYGIK